MEFFYQFGLLIGIYSLINQGSASSIFPKPGDPGAIYNDFICVGNHFSISAVMKNHRIACDSLHNAEPDQVFPAHLKDTQLFGPNLNPLFTWPIISEDKIFRSSSFFEGSLFPRYKGRPENANDVFSRATRKFAPRYRFELQFPSEKDRTKAQDLEYYVGYKCSDVVFGAEYVRESVTSAQNNLVKKKGIRFPKLYFLQSLEKLVFINRKKEESYNYFVIFSKSFEILHVVDKSFDIDKTCNMFSGRVVDPHHRIEALSTLEIDSKADREDFDCNGQIFGGSFISKNKEKAIDAYSRRDGRLKKYKLPCLIEKESANIPGKAWMWPLRIPETSKRKSKSTTSYQLIFGEDHQFLGVYHLSETTYVRCHNRNDPDNHSSKFRFLFDLNSKTEEKQSPRDTDYMVQ
ncbi:CSEP0383 putative effector protein [Blumeria hordei DH14]|uniref:CSEP0383 putative effector protein n=1 Tax=Blumeria graminis f. sp. hordei (strain DH14) TaxID=546991 RepID=N1J9P0_BLUG1|nr:CSEP0383 putative effector protein [Blumeria hordei DH14]